MHSSDIPARFPTAFGASADAGLIRTVPATSADPFAASLALGFPPATFTDPSAGGKNPDGRDFNGILRAITQWNRWQQSGGPALYDSTFSGQIGGYPAGADIASDSTAGISWRSTIDNNTTNPNTGGANWTANGFAPGTKLLFFQASAPVGWTQVTTYNDCALRIVNGSGGGSHTSGQAFSTAFANGTVNGHSLSQAELPNCSFTETAPGHHHFIGNFVYNGGTGGNNGGIWGSGNPLNTESTQVSVNSGGSGMAHTHAFTSSVFNINYVDAIICTKN
jgi:hypothetical protein